jgi:hypothetical protein
MWAQGHNGWNTRSNLCQSPCAISLCPDIRRLSSVGMPQKVPRHRTGHDDHRARVAVWAYCPLFDWTGTSPVGCSGRRLPSEWTGHIKCRDGTSPVCRVDRRRVFSAINEEIAWPRGLTSGSARRLTSRAIGHVAAPGPHLSGERMHTGQDPDKCLRQTPVRP